MKKEFMLKVFITVSCAALLLNLTGCGNGSNADVSSAQASSQKQQEDGETDKSGEAEKTGGSDKAGGIDDVGIAETTDGTGNVGRAETIDGIEQTDMYGVFVMSAKSADKCVEAEMSLEDAGLSDNVMIYTPDFSGLNPEPYYAVAAGLFESEDEANERLEEVLSAGFSDAYVKLAGRYIGDEYLYTMYDPEGIDILNDCVILHDVAVSLPYPVGSDYVQMDLYVGRDAEFDPQGDIDTFANYEKGDTPYEWIVRNHELMETDPDAYSQNGPALSGVFRVSIDGDVITSYHGSYWWD